MRNRTFNAVLIDAALYHQIKDQRFTGRVHSIFDQAINVEVDGLGLVTVISPRKSHGPAFIKACPFPSLKDALRVRARAVLTHKELVFPSPGVRISLDDARLWRGKRAITATAGVEEMIDRKAYMEEALAFPRGGLASMKRGVDSLSKAIVSMDGARMKDGLDSLIGLGEGLTPEGDDLLLGLLCFIHSVPPERRGEKLEAFLGCFSEKIGEYRDSTTFTGYSFLRYGSEGRFFEPLLNLCRAALLDGGRGPAGGRGLEKSVASLLGVGATSGLNMLRGVVIGLDLLLQG